MTTPKPALIASALVLTFLLDCKLYAQDQSTDASNSSVDIKAYLNQEGSISTKTKLKLRDAPSTISLITAEEIREMGAKDLMDVLNLVSGINFGLDVVGVVGMSSRGNWAHEGKILLQFDGQEMNDLSYANTEFGHHFDVTQIERIEIVKGATSSLYGNYAELGVINIITKTGASLKGAQVSSTYGLLNNTYERRNLSLAIGNSNKNITYSVSGMVGQGKRSNQDYTDAYGNTISMNNNSTLYPALLNGSIKIKGFSARVFYDLYKLNSPFYFDKIQSPNETHSTSGTYGELKYDWQVNEKLLITPKVNFKQVEPWRTEADSPTDQYEVLTTRVAPSLTAFYNPSNKVNVVAGTDSYFDHGKRIHSSEPNYFNGTPELSFHNVAVYGQLHFKNDFVPLLAGARLDNHSVFGSTFSPRVGLTKIINTWNFKLLFSRAFRSASLANYNLNQGLTYEHTNTLEMEVGKQLGENMLITATLYNIHISDPILYYFNDQYPPPFGNFINYKNTGTKGFELEYRYKARQLSFFLNYAYYSASGINEVEIYKVPGNENNMLAWPSSKVNFNGTLKLTKKLSINSTASYFSKRFAFTKYDANGNLVLSSIDPKLYLNFFLLYRDMLTKGLDLGMGVNDVMDQKQIFIQPYNSASAPITGTGREFLIRMSYSFPFNAK